MKKKKVLFYITISILFLIIGTKSSPLYKINDWYDAECFFTMGKSMMKGIVPYLDLFEQKGPLLFFIYGIASLLSENSFLGVFILEIISYTIFLYYIDKIISLYIDKKYSYILLPILSLLILSSRSFTHGGSCEEFCFPMLAIITYYLIKYLKTKQITNKQVLIVGIMSGFIFWMKYTLLGLTIGFCLIFAIEELKNKNFKNLFIKSGYFLLGIIITSIPWLIYFGIHKNGIKSLIDIYFLFNMTHYADDLTWLQKLFHCLNTIKGVLLKYHQYIILIFIPILLSIKGKIFFEKRIENCYLLLVVLLELFFLFIGGTNYRYYSLPMQPFMIFGLITIIILLEKIIKEKIILKYIVPLSILTVIICLPIAYLRSPNTEYIKKNKSYYAQFTFLEKMKPNSTILNYGFLDGGFYLTANTYPNVYYFQKNNIKYHLYPENTEEQRRYIKEKLVDYVITRNPKQIDKELLEKNYELIDIHKQKYEEKYRTYYLYKKRNN